MMLLLGRSKRNTRIYLFRTDLPDRRASTAPATQISTRTWDIVRRISGKSAVVKKKMQNN